MIKANELRIGNWVSESVLGNCRIIAVHTNVGQVSKNDRQSYSIDIENLGTIPLTPEILEKAGFTNNNNFFVYKDYSLLRDMGGWHFDYIDADCRGERAIAYPDYLHQLQNLYFALTGEELIIKEETPA